MPELPEVEALARFLTEQTAGREIQRAELASLSALKTFDPPLEALAGRTISAVGRRGKFLLVDTAGIWVAIHLSRSGWVRWVENLSPALVRPGKGPLALRVRLAGGGGFDVSEAATEKRLAIYVTPNLDDVEHLVTLGPDPLDPAFDVDAFAAVLAGQKAQIKGVLIDQQRIAGVGNAYSDEALHLARLSPFKTASSLTTDEVERLYGALIAVLREAVERSDGKAASELKDAKRSGMRVHGREGEPCPACGDAVRSVHFASKSLQYCPTCQTGGKLLADRRLSRLLK